MTLLDKIDQAIWHKPFGFALLIICIALGIAMEINRRKARS